MALIVFTSAAGSPGVTTAAVGLTLTWPRSAILVDADPGACRSVLAGYLRGEVATAKGLQRVAEAHRDRRPLAELVSDETIPLTDDAEGGRRLLPGFGLPAGATLFGPVWPDLTEAFVRFEEAGIDVLVDAGRLTAAGLPQPLLDRADLVLILTRTSLRSIAAVRSHSQTFGEHLGTAGDNNLGLVLVGEDQPYGRREISRLLGLEVITVIADDAESAAVFSDGAPRSRRFERSPLARSLHRAADDLDRQIRQRRTRWGLDDPRPGSEPTSPADDHHVRPAVPGLTVGAGTGGGTDGGA